MARDRRRHFERHILPAIGGKRLRAVTHADCIDLHRGIKAPYEANRAIQSWNQMGLDGSQPGDRYRTQPGDTAQ
jgi:hypothetical protein